MSALVAKPGPDDAGCWALPGSSAVWARSTNCRRKPRRGCLTCGSHTGMEAAAQRLKASLGGSIRPSAPEGPSADGAASADPRSARA